MISTLIALPYELARLPLVLVDGRLSERLSEASVPRTTLDRALGSADKVAGTLLGNRDIVARGTDRLERSRKLRSAARLEAEAKATREQAHDTAAAGRHQAALKRRDAEERVTSGLEEADNTEARGKRDARVTAAKTAASKKAAADKRAASRKAAAEKREQGVESAAEAKKKAAQRAARSELDDAREAKQAATKARAEAERLSDLTEAKKAQRKQK